MDLNSIGTEFNRGSLNRQDLSEDPFQQFQQWMTQAIQGQIKQPNAMTLSTVSLEGQPSARVVYLKEMDSRGFVFFTNYQSQKAKNLDGNPKAAATFYWPELDQQVRIEGTVEKTSDAESDGYFASRSQASQWGAWASRQSEILTSRDVLEAQYQSAQQTFPGTVPRPPHWGGYRLSANSVEFWQGRLNRCHDRFQYKLSAKGWTIHRLSP